MSKHEWGTNATHDPAFGPPHTYWYMREGPRGAYDINLKDGTNEYNVSGWHIIKDHISSPYPTLEAAKAACVVLDAARSE